MHAAGMFQHKSQMLDCSAVGFSGNHVSLRLERGILIRVSRPLTGTGCLSMSVM